jgi:hypothetical protein
MLNINQTKFGLVLRKIFAHKSDDVQHCGKTGGPRATYGPIPLVTRPEKLFVNVLLVTTSLLLYSKGFEEKIVILISSAALRTSATHAIDFETQS